MESCEVKTHSAFLRELLDPKGSHGMGAVFLNLFLGCISDANNQPFKTASATVEAEKFIGQINTECNHGGRIDLYLEDECHQHIFIENKIYAGDQETQMLRYHNHDKHATLIYLTLEGNEPNESSTGGEAFDLIKLTYKKDIKNWLEMCRKESVTHPVVRESLSQYIQLICALTNQTEEDAMMEEIKELVLEKPELAKSIDLLNEAWGQIKDEVSKSFWNLIKQQFPMDLDPIEGELSGKAQCYEDNDGVHVQFHISKDGVEISANELANRLYVQLSRIEQTMQKHNAYVAWYNPKPFKRRDKVACLDPSEIIKLRKNPCDIETMVQGISDQTRDIWKQLGEQLK
jgi:hypothetical protein